MKKVAIFLFIIMMVIFLANEVEAIGIGVTTLTGDFHYEEDRFSYTPGVTPYLLMGYKVNNNLSVLLSGMGSYHLPDKYISEKNGELEIADGDLIYLQILLNAKYNFRPDDTFQPYIKAGVGGYNFYGNIKAKNESEITLSISRPGAKLGLGYEIKENLRLSLEAIESNDNYEFKDWSGDYESNEKKIDFKVKEDMNLTADFVRKTVELSLNKKGQGSINVTPEKDEYKVGDEITLEAIADEDYEFITWTDDLAGDWAFSNS